LSDAISIKRNLETLKSKYLHEEALISEWRSDTPTHISFDKILRKVAGLPDTQSFMSKFANIDIISMAKSDLEKAVLVKAQAEQLL
jgi:hypothetical protein